MPTDRLLGPEVSDVDGNTEDRFGTASVFNGPEPAIQCLTDEAAEVAAVGAWLAVTRPVYIPGSLLDR